VIFVHDLAFRLRPSEVPWQQRLYFRSVLPPALRQAAAVLVPSETTRADLLRLYPLTGLDSRVHVVPEGLPRRVAAGPLPEGIAPGFVLAVGTVEPRKNYRRLLDAYRRLRERPGFPQLVIAGRPGWAYGDTLTRIQSEPGVRYLGHVDEPTLEALYQSASVLAFPSLYEGFGLPLLEAMAHGVPAVIGGTGALPELGQGAALAVEAEDSDAIAAALERLLSDEPMRAQMAEEGRRLAASFDWKSAAESALRVLHEVGRKSEKRVA
jgi:glycosyltransferase involved in cell wall biosynthesis